eukprot:3294194-Rhodomonas_salina.1
MLAMSRRATHPRGALALLSLAKLSGVAARRRAGSLGAWRGEEQVEVRRRSPPTFFHVSSVLRPSRRCFFRSQAGQIGVLGCRGPRLTAGVVGGAGGDGECASAAERGRDAADGPGWSVGDRARRCGCASMWLLSCGAVSMRLCFRYGSFCGCGDGCAGCDHGTELTWRVCRGTARECVEKVMTEKDALSTEVRRRLLHAAYSALHRR